MPKHLHPTSFNFGPGWAVVSVVGMSISNSPQSLLFLMPRSSLGGEKNKCPPPDHLAPFSVPSAEPWPPSRREAPGSAVRPWKGWGQQSVPVDAQVCVCNFLPVRKPLNPPRFCFRCSGPGGAGLSQVAWPHSGGEMPWTVLLFAAGELSPPGTPGPLPTPPTWPPLWGQKPARGCRPGAWRREP